MSRKYQLNFMLMGCAIICLTNMAAYKSYSSKILTNTLLCAKCFHCLWKIKAFHKKRRLGIFNKIFGRQIPALAIDLVHPHLPISFYVNISE